jgi:hypothetical protein
MEPKEATQATGKILKRLLCGRNDLDHRLFVLN